MRSSKRVMKLSTWTYAESVSALAAVSWSCRLFHLQLGHHQGLLDLGNLGVGRGVFVSELLSMVFGEPFRFPLRRGGLLVEGRLQFLLADTEAGYATNGQDCYQDKQQ